jgi:hypothetical protein
MVFVDVEGKLYNFRFSVSKKKVEQLHNYTIVNVFLSRLMCKMSKYVY